ncbi:hypothetical protein LOC68_15590 [Blastopirellula sp. JC732]|uniref:Uncharacterized protein n=1 Tax=Blastopirellula sediminis TaxID=2894196 RepID=A0A9X1MPT3_9BACT|nr:hypothetical protein [Blastopirellula sediminis]MCC9606892.1 hypothetical protein [Blastopirellula sediminis]MCC9629812.1 hypothetical protein [Blastopirellula sediminis]
METDGKQLIDENIIEFLGDHIHVTARGNNSLEKSFRLLCGIVAACEEFDCYNILGEAETKEELSTMGAFKHIDLFMKAGITWKHRIAWVAEAPDKYEQLKFVETVLRNRALANGHVFHTVPEARKWLLNDVTADVDAPNTSDSPTS